MKTLKSIAAATALLAAGACFADTAAPPLPGRVAVQAPALQPGQLPDALGLVEFLSQVRSQNPVLRTMPLRQGMAQADVRTASTWANPSVHYTRKPDEKEWGIEQPIPIFGQVGMRTEAARLAAVAGQAGMQVEAQDVMTQAASRFAELLVAQEKLAARQQAVDHLEQAVKIVHGQMELGARSKYDGARVDLQRAQVQAQLEQQEAQTQAARAALADLLARPGWTPRAVGSVKPAATPQPEPTLDAMWLQAEPVLPQLQAAHAKVVQSEQLIRQQAREALPTPTLGIARIRNRPDHDAYNMVGVAVELPLFDRKQGAVERARLEYAQAQLEEETAQQQARLRLQQALTQRNLLRKTLLTFESRGLSKIDPLRQMAQDSYKLGKSSILEWLDAMESVSEHQQEYFDLTLRVWQAEWELNTARGMALLPLE